MTPRDLKSSTPRIVKTDVLIVGAGAAGCYAALNVAPLKTIILSPKGLGGESSSLWAQGGIAGAVDKDDTPNLHMRDTLKAAAGTADHDVVRMITAEAPNIMRDLDARGVLFERTENGDYALSREACHTMRRVLKSKAGDGFGRALMMALIENVGQSNYIDVAFPYTAERLFQNDRGDVAGVYARHIITGEVIIYRARAVIMATGGVGGLFETTTNPLSSVGRGVAIAGAAGAELSDLEFVQFHPTALDIGLDPAPLATEALRGEGARLINDKGEYFMDPAFDTGHPARELAPRDVVSRSIFKHLQRGRVVSLDCRGIDVEKFPALVTACAKAGLDPKTTPVPVRPATHYYMGGIASDKNGRTSLNGLWAAGEVAATGLHGANRLASNSLLEALVMGQRAALDIIKQKPVHADFIPVEGIETFGARMSDDTRQMFKKHIRHIMTSCVGVMRQADDLNDAITLFSDIVDFVETRDLEIFDMAQLAKWTATAALKRTESRGGHARSDYPKSNPKWKHRSFVTPQPFEYVQPATKVI